MFRRKLSALIVFASLAALGLPSSAMAGVADYTNGVTFGIPNNTGQAGIPSQVFVPPGRTAVQSLELTRVMPSFGGGGGGDLQLRLSSPAGTEINLISNGCTNYPNTSAFTISDAAAEAIDNSMNFCNNQLPTGSGRPTNPLATFNGQPTAGVWTVTVVDVGVSMTLGSWKGWTLHLTHAPPTLTGAPSSLQVPGLLAVTATCNADCTVTTGGDAQPASQSLAANSPGLIVAPATAQALQRLKPKKKKGKKGKKKKAKPKTQVPASVTLTATDQTGGTATATVQTTLFGQTKPTQKKK